MHMLYSRSCPERMDYHQAITKHVKHKTCPVKTMLCAASFLVLVDPSMDIRTCLARFPCTPADARSAHVHVNATTAPVSESTAK